MRLIHILKRSLEAIAALLSNPKHLYYVLNNEDYFQTKVNKELGAEAANLKTIGFADLQISFPKTLSTYSFLGGTSSPTDLIL
jgi:hypothetical protein